MSSFNERLEAIQLDLKDLSVIDSPRKDYYYYFKLKSLILPEMEKHSSPENWLVSTVVTVSHLLNLELNLK